MANFSLFSDFNDFVSPYQDALAQVVDRSVCANYETISGFWRGKFGIAGAWPAYAKAFRDCGADFGGGTSGNPGAELEYRPGPEFTGGQCPVIYLVSYTFVLENSGPFNGQNTFLGPIAGAVFFPADNVPGSPNQYGRGGVAFGDPVQESIIASGSASDELTSFVVTGVVRDDGLPDDCGSLPDDNPSFPPVIIPPTPDPVNPNDPIVIITQDITEVVTVVRDTDTYTFTFNVGDISVLPNGNVQVDVDGLPTQITPELDVNSPYVNEARVPENFIPISEVGTLALQAQVLELRLAIECVINDICEGESFNIPLPKCDGSVTSVAGITSGTKGLVDVLGDVAITLNENIIELCDAEPEPPVNVPAILLTTQTVSLNTQAGQPVPLNNDVQYVDIVFTAIGDANKIYKIGPDNETQGRFGFLIVGYQVGPDRFWAEPMPLWFAKNTVKVPRDRPGTVWVRVSSHTQFTYQLYDSGVRL